VATTSCSTESPNRSLNTKIHARQHPIPALPQTSNIPNVAKKLTPAPTADFVQELYLKELKAYKPTPIKESDAVGQVATFSLPKAPKSPEEADLSSSLQEYEALTVEVEGSEGLAAGQTPVVEDWLVEEEEETAHGH
jgi:F-type H+-transporting ATPase subunit h